MFRFVLLHEVSVRSCHCIEVIACSLWQTMVIAVSEVSDPPPFNNNFVLDN